MNPHLEEKTKTKIVEKLKSTIMLSFSFFSDRLVVQSKSAGPRLPFVCPAQSSSHLSPNRPGSRQFHLHQIPVSGQDLRLLFSVEIRTYRHVQNAV